ncbi:MAG: ABC-2 family transporter protein, partial [Candidatus Moranbacteria bacterium]|nr:ABC-2 family transporter protein [Candidatus Moranbacteria bacterium]
KKYLTVVKTEWVRQMAYRTNQFTFRIGNIFEILIQIIIWTAIFQKTATLKGYTYPEMMTYILMGWLLAFLMQNFGFEEVLSDQIEKGELANFVSKPIDYVKYLIFLAIGRASFTLAVAFGINIIILFLFRHIFILSGNIFVWPILIAMVVAGFFINLFISILIGFTSFWTVDNNGIFYSINTLGKFLSGTYFPVNILPSIFLNISLALPFAYTFYFPAQFYLGKISVTRGLIGLGIEIFWVAVLYAAVRLTWRAGLKKFESVGI